MKASAGAAKTSAAKFCNCATGDQEGWLAIHATPESLRVAEESGSTLNHQQMPTPGRVPGTRQNICKFRPLSQIYEVRDHPLNSVPLTCICQDQKRTRRHDIVCFGWEL